MTDEDAATGPGARLHSSSAMVRAESDQLDATVHALVATLSSIPGLNMVISYREGRLRRLIGDLPYINDLHRRSDPVRRIVVTIGGGSYWLDSDEGTIRCGRDAASIGPEPRQEQLSFADWATALFDEISRQNFVNHESMVALRRLVEQDQV
jgi:hypothetical protein